MSEVKRLVYFGTSVEPSWLVESLNEVPEIKQGEILAKVLLTTISPSVCQALQEKELNTPVVLGYESVCEVIKDMREKNTENFPVPFQRGTRITFSTSVPCNQCNFCKNHSYSNCCENIFNYGQASISNDPTSSGCYSTHIVLRPGTYVVSIPDCLNNFEAVTINSSLAIAIHAVEAARGKHGNKVALVQGAGMKGLYICSLLRQQGYSQVFCRDDDHNRLKTVPRFGAIPVHANEISQTESCRELKICQSQITSVDCVIEVCGNPRAISEGISAVKCGGTYVIVGLKHNADSLNITGKELVQKSITIKGINSYEPRHLEEAVRFLKENKSIYPIESTISTRTYSLNEFDEAIHMAKLRTYHRICIKPHS